MIIFKQLPGKLCMIEILLNIFIFIGISMVHLIKGTDMWLNKDDQLKAEKKDENRRNEENPSNPQVLYNNRTDKIDIKEKFTLQFLIHLICVGIFLSSHPHHIIGSVFCFIHLILMVVYYFALYKNLGFAEFLPLGLGVLNIAIFIIGLNQKRISSSLK